ncbi:hypothetical protein [Clostridium sp.]|uniref:hypothetical protein n=1 Tax=Clostridium sp. TaxID=1506 RepID=UPI00261879A1|nr:hypothetical protein [Clostridium sp.]
MEILIILVLLFTIIFNIVYGIPKKLNSQAEKQSLMMKELNLRLTNIENKIDSLDK